MSVINKMYATKTQVSIKYRCDVCNSEQHVEKELFISNICVDMDKLCVLCMEKIDVFSICIDISKLDDGEINFMLMNDIEPLDW